MWSYNQAFEPPAPFLEVTIHHPYLSNRRHLIPAKLDTGADLSAIPKSIAEKLQLLPSRTILAEGYDGKQSIIETYAITLEIAQAHIRHIEVILISDDYALVGRDILNHFYTRLNGPDLNFDLYLAPHPVS
jgi:predicted aspartyl protease